MSNKTILVLIIIAYLLFGAIAAPAFADLNIISLGFSTEVGYLPLNAWQLHGTTYTGVGLDFYSTLAAEIIILDTVFVGGSARTFMSFTNSDRINFSPSEIWYSFNAGLRFGGLEIGFRHACLHPIYPYINQVGQGQVNAEGAYEELYLSFKGKINLWTIK